MWKLCEIQISVPINMVLLEHSYTLFLNVLSVTVFVLQQQGWVVAYERWYHLHSQNTYYLAFTNDNSNFSL